MQLNGNTVGEYMSRKYTLTLVALITVCFKLLTTTDPMWAIALTGAIVGIIGQYAYFNVQESKSIKELKMAGMADAPSSSPPKPPVEPDGV